MDIPNPYLSVIIPTKNRAEELRTISLPSLAKQTAGDFEIVVWDASESDLSRCVVEDFSDAHPNLIVNYFKAPRHGSAAQRNDAVKEAKGEIVFFIDDDSEVSPDGIAALRDMFTQEAIAGGCLPLDYFLFRAGMGQAIHEANRRWTILLAIYRKVFDPLFGGSGVFTASEPGSPNLVNYLSGCDMAYRRGILRNYCFNERLQRYAGYALWEDIEFSHILYRRGHILSVSEYGHVVHRAAPGQRGEHLLDKARMQGYNSCVVWKTSISPFTHWSVIPFVWSRIGFLGVVLMPCLSRPWQMARWKRVEAYLSGLWAFFREDILGFAPNV